MSVAGTRDFLPNDMLVQEWLFNKWSNVAQRFNFKKYSTPVVEQTSLYKRKGGDDIVNEMFLLEDKELCLRPELTPSLVRIISNQNPKAVPFPLRYWSIGQCWRYETITKNRKREHNQFNCDIIDLQQNIRYEAELISLIVTFFKDIGLSSQDIQIRISSRKVIGNTLDKYSINEDNQLLIFNILDKINKKDISEIKEELLVLLNEEQVTELLSIMTSDNINDTELIELLNLVKAYGIESWIKVDYSLVRGLSYYTGIVFEAFATGGTRSICGGGRYNNLMKTLGYKTNYPIVGFGMGDVVIVELLQELGKLPTFNNSADYLVVPFSEQFYNDAITITNVMRTYNKKIELYAKKKFKVTDAYIYANRIGATYVILIAPEEWLNNRNIVVKEMEKKGPNQVTINIDEFYASFLVS